jgi:hypothetical protein
MSALTEKRLQQLSRQVHDRMRRYWDGDGLYAQVSPKGAISFAMKYRLDGKERRKGLGAWGKDLSLADARRKAREHRVSLDSGEGKSANAGQVHSFREAGEEWMAVNESRLKPRTMAQVRPTWALALKRSARRTFQM